MTLAELNRSATRHLVSSLGEREARAAARLIMEDVLGVSQTNLIVNGDRELEPETVTRISKMLVRIAYGEPTQYVIGYARFMGLNLRVTQATLIPRPETEGLVDLIVKVYKGLSDLRILDIGTGSGCIAIALARALPFAQIDAYDISVDALTVATENAHNLNVKINFRQLDILEAVPPLHEYDIIVSNPPYIADFERSEMERRVLDHEPHSALFVPDNNPLLFYKAIARYATDALKPQGRLYFEINPLFHKELEQELEHLKYTRIQTHLDYIGILRFTSSQKGQ